MPNRIFRDWTDSKPVHRVKESGEVLFTRLLMKADDYSRFHADPQAVRSLCFPLRDDLRNTDIAARLVSLQGADLVRCYEIAQTGTSRWLDDTELAGMPAAGASWYLVIPKFGQQKRAEKSKFPDPPPDDERLLRSRIAVDEQLRPYAKAKPKAYSYAQSLGELPPALNTPEFIEAWKDFWQHREEIKHPLTPTASKNLFAELVEMGSRRAIAATRHSIANGWRGIFEDKSRNGAGHANGNQRKAQPFRGATARPSPEL